MDSSESINEEKHEELENVESPIVIPSVSSDHGKVAIATHSAAGSLTVEETHMPSTSTSSNTGEVATLTYPLVEYVRQPGSSTTDMNPNQNVEAGQQILNLARTTNTNINFTVDLSHSTAPVQFGQTCVVAAVKEDATESSSSDGECERGTRKQKSKKSSQKNHSVKTEDATESSSSDNELERRTRQQKPMKSDQKDNSVKTEERHEVYDGQSEMINPCLSSEHEEVATATFASVRSVNETQMTSSSTCSKSGGETTLTFPLMEFIGQQGTSAVDLNQNQNVAAVQQIFNIARTTNTNINLNVDLSHSTGPVQFGQTCLVTALQDCRSDLSPELEANEAYTKQMIKQHKNHGSFYNTRATAHAVKVFTDRGVLILTGKPGSGKTTLAKEIMLQFHERHGEYRLLNIDNDLTYIDSYANSGVETILLLDDIFGKTNLNESLLKENGFCLENILVGVQSGTLKVIFTIRDHILEKSYSFLEYTEAIKLFSRKNIINLSTGAYQLEAREKREMFQLYCSKNKITAVDHDMQENYTSEAILDENVEVKISWTTIIDIIDSNPVFGFPQTCMLFCSVRKYTRLGSRFFLHPRQNLLDEINSLCTSESKYEVCQYCILVYMVITGEIINLEHLDMETWKTISRSFMLNVTEATFKIAVNNITNKYIESIGEAYTFRFKHETILEAVAISLSSIDMNLLLKYCKLDFIKEFVRTSAYKVVEGEVVIILKSDQEYLCLAERVMLELSNSLSSLKNNLILQCPVIDDPQFVSYFLDVIKCNRCYINMIKESCSKEGGLFEWACTYDKYHLVAKLYSSYSKFIDTDWCLRYAGTKTTKWLLDHGIGIHNIVDAIYGAINEDKLHVILNHSKVNMSNVIEVLRKYGRFSCMNDAIINNLLARWSKIKLELVLEFLRQSKRNQFRWVNSAILDNEEIVSTFIIMVQGNKQYLNILMECCRKVEGLFFWACKYDKYMFAIKLYTHFKEYINIERCLVAGKSITKWFLDKGLCSNDIVEALYEADKCKLTIMLNHESITLSNVLKVIDNYGSFRMMTTDVLRRIFAKWPDSKHKFLESFINQVDNEKYDWLSNSAFDDLDFVSYFLHNIQNPKYADIIKRNCVKEKGLLYWICKYDKYLLVEHINNTFLEQMNSDKCLCIAKEATSKLLLDHKLGLQDVADALYLASERKLKLMLLHKNLELRHVIKAINRYGRFQVSKIELIEIIFHRWPESKLCLVHCLISHMEKKNYHLVTNIEFDNQEFVSYFMNQVQANGIYSGIIQKSCFEKRGIYYWACRYKKWHLVDKLYKWPGSKLFLVRTLLFRVKTKNYHFLSDVIWDDQEFVSFFMNQIEANDKYNDIIKISCLEEDGIYYWAYIYKKRYLVDKLYELYHRELDRKGKHKACRAS